MTVRQTQIVEIHRDRLNVIADQVIPERAQFVMVGFIKKGSCTHENILFKVKHFNLFQMWTNATYQVLFPVLSVRIV